MQNLAGNKQCDEVIASELERCGIERVQIERGNTEVPYSIVGRLGDFEFKRAWYYWTVKGKVPIAVAEELYADPVGKTDVRVNGHCGCPAPDESQVTFFDDRGREILKTPDDNKEFGVGTTMRTKLEKMGYRLAPDPAAIGKPCVNSYHIDSELGLYVFVQALKRHGLA